MKPWPTVSLGDLLRLERRKVKVEPEKLYQEIGIYCFGRGIFHKNPRTGFEVGDKDLFLMKEGDFILQVTFAWEGAIAIVSAAEDGMYGSTRYPTFRVDESRCVPHFLLNYFKTEEGRQQLVKICPGSAGRNRVLSIKRIPEVLVPLPPLAEQRRVVARIEELAAQIHEARTLRHQATEEADNLMASQLMQIFDEAAEAKKYQTRLGDVCTFQGGSQPAKLQFAYEPRDGYIRLIQIRDYKSDDYLTFVPKDSVRKFCTKDDVMIGRYGPPIFQILRGIEGAYNVALMKATPDESCVSKDFLFHLLQEPRLFQKVEEDSQRTSGQTGIRRELLEDHITFVPPLAEQRRIVAELDALQAEVDALKRLQAETAAELAALLPAILDRAFKGEL